MAHVIARLIVLLILGTSALSWQATLAAPRGPQTKEYQIHIDPTALHPPTRWYVPGVTPIIWSLDPESTDAFRTTEAHEVTLRPGNYRFGTFTFDFPFVVTLDGLLDYAPNLDKCVKGRGTQTLKILCSHTMPLVGETDYWADERKPKPGRSQDEGR